MLLAAVLLPAAGLVRVGFTAYEAEEVRAELAAREALSVAEALLAEEAEGILLAADRAADAWYESEEKSPLVSTPFLADQSGRLLLPEMRTHPAPAPPPEGELDEVGGLLREADRIVDRTGNALDGAAVIEAAVDRYAHADLMGPLLLHAATLYEKAGRRDRSRFYLEQILALTPGGRDLDGDPLGPTAWLRLIATADSAEVKRAAVAEFALALADHAWSLPPYRRDLLLERLEEVSAPEGLPAEVRERIRWVDALRTRVLPEATAKLAEGGERTWRHALAVSSRGVEVLGWRPLLRLSGPHVFGYRLDPVAFRDRLGRSVADLARRSGARILVGLDPPVATEGPPRQSGVELRTDLGGALAAIPVVIRTSPDTSALRTLRILHLGMTVLLTGALLAGLLLSLRAIRKEIATARLRQDFIDNVSHELRTPLTSIRMYAEMLDEEELPEEKVRGYLGWIRRESERLSRLIEDVLDFSRLSRGRGRFDLGPRRVDEIVKAAAKLVAPLADELGVAVETDVPEDLPPVRADRDAAVRVLVNLLDNAAQHAGPEKRIGVAARADGGVVRVVVWDRGPGIPPEDRERLFTRFYRSSRDSRRGKGMGLGLTLSREIARAGGGDLVLDSSSESGSRFAWIVPVEEEA